MRSIPPASPIGYSPKVGTIAMGRAVVGMCDGSDGLDKGRQGNFVELP